MRRGPRCSHSGGECHVRAEGASVVPKRTRPHEHAAGASVVPKCRRPHPRSGRGLGRPKTEEAPTSMWRGPRCCQNGACPLAHATEALVVPKRRRTPRKQRRPPWSPCTRGPRDHAMGASLVPKRRRSPRPCGGGLGGPKAKEVSSRMWRGPQWSQNGGGPRLNATGASVLP